MIIGSMNIRGGDNTLKRKRINSLISMGNADVFLIQETKLSNFQEGLVKSFGEIPTLVIIFPTLRGCRGNLNFVEEMCGECH